MDDYDYDNSPYESQVSAQTLSSRIHYAIAWEELHNIQEAISEECPFQELMASIFDWPPTAVPSQTRDTRGTQLPTKQVSCLTEAKQKELKALATEIHQAACKLDKSNDDAAWFNACHKLLMTKAGRAIIPPFPLCLPSPLVPPRRREAMHPLIRGVISVSQVRPSGLVRTDIQKDIRRDFRRCLSKPGNYLSPTLAQQLMPDVQNSYNPYHYEGPPKESTTQAEFFSTAFTTLSALTEYDRTAREPQFYPLHRYNRLATTTMLRELQAFHISDLPVFGVLMSRSRVAFHVDWWEQDQGRGPLTINSAFYTRSSDLDWTSWDLRNFDDALRVVAILDRIYAYTQITFKTRVQNGMKNVDRILRGQFRPWKWHAPTAGCDEGDSSDDELQEGSSAEWFVSPAEDEDEQALRNKENRAPESGNVQMPTALAPKQITILKRGTLPTPPFSPGNRVISSTPIGG